MVHLMMVFMLLMTIVKHKLITSLLASSAWMLQSNELDMPTNMREQWGTTAHDILEISNHRAVSSDLVEFIERHIRIISDPVFGDISDVSSGTTGSK